MVGSAGEMQSTNVRGRAVHAIGIEEERVVEDAGRLGRHPPFDPVGVRTVHPEGARRRRGQHPVAGDRRPPFLPRRRRNGRGPRLAGRRDDAVDVDQPPDLGAERVRGAGDRHSAVAVPDQHRVPALLGTHGGHHVGDMRPQRDLRGHLVRPLPQPGQRDRHDPMPRRPESGQHAPPAPGPVPCTVHQNDVGHPASLLRRVARHSARAGRTVGGRVRRRPPHRGRCGLPRRRHQLDRRRRLADPVPHPGRARAAAPSPRTSPTRSPSGPATSAASSASATSTSGSAAG